MSSKAVEPTGEVHPVADLFPMMTDDELDDLAADIKANGLLHPIVLDENGVLIDGRNRMAGCLRAGVEPTFTALNGHDPKDFIFSLNASRRNTTQGQRAMAAVEAYWDEGLYKLYKPQSFVAQKAGVPQARIAEALVVKQYASHLAPNVRLGITPLSVATEEARSAKEEEESEEEKAVREQAEEQEKFSRLQSGCPELAVKVQEGELTLTGALAEWEERQRQEREHISAVTKMLDTGLNYLDPRHWEVDTHVRGWLKADPKRLGDTADFSAERARRVAGALLRYAELKENEDV